MAKKNMCCLCGVLGDDLLATDPPTPIPTKIWDKKEEDCSVKIYIKFARSLIVFNNKIGKLLCIKSGWETTGLELVPNRSEVVDHGNAPLYHSPNFTLYDTSYSKYYTLYQQSITAVQNESM